MEENTTKKTRAEVDIKFPLIFSFILLVFCVLIGFSKDKFAYWGIHEEILSSGQIGMIPMISAHIALLSMLFIFIRFGYSAIIHWIALILIFGALGLYLFNNGSCLTEKGLYERDFGKTVYYSFDEIESYKVIKNKTIENQGSQLYKVSLKNGKTFAFQQLKPQYLTKINQTILMAERKVE